MLDDHVARRLFEELLGQPGALRIITNLPDPGAPTADPRDPAYWVQYDVVTSEEAPGGMIMARSAEGALCLGMPLDVLVRTSEHRTYDPADPISTRATTEAMLAELAVSLDN